MNDAASQKTTSTFSLPLLGAIRVSTLVLLAVGLVGGLFIYDVAGWRFSPPVFFMWMGWAAVLFSCALLWRAAFVSGVDDEEYESVDEINRQELLAEKKVLIRSIKDIEFDRDMGKLSDDDVVELTSVYKKRAIEIIKTLDGGISQKLSIEEQIERDIAARKQVQDDATVKRARLVASAGTKGKGKRKGTLGATMPEPGTKPGEGSTTGARGSSVSSTTNRRRFASDMLEEASVDEEGGQWEEDGDSKVNK